MTVGDVLIVAAAGVGLALLTVWLDRWLMGGRK